MPRKQSPVCRLCASICFFIQSQCNRTNQVPQRGEGVELQPGFSSSANEGKTITVRGYSLLLRGPLDTVFPPPLSAGISLIPGTVAGTTDQLFCNQRSKQSIIRVRVELDPRPTSETCERKHKVCGHPSLQAANHTRAQSLFF